MKNRKIQSVILGLVSALLIFNSSLAQDEINQKSAFSKQIEEIEKIADLREKDSDGNYIHAGKTVKYTGGAVITAISDDSYYIEDTSAAIQIYDPLNKIDAVYELYHLLNDTTDNIYITGEIQVQNSMLRLFVNEDFTNSAPDGPEKIEPTLFSLNEITSDHQSRLVKFENVHFTGINEGQTFEEGMDYTITDGTNDFTLRAVHYYNDSTSYIGKEIPHHNININGIINQHQTTMRLFPRFDADFTDFYPITFEVEDGDQSSIDGARIAVNNQELTTDGQGMATINLEDGDYEYTVNHEDFLEKTGTLSVEGGEKTVNVVMTPLYTVTFGVEAGNGSVSATADGDAVSTGDKVAGGSEVVFTAEPGAGNKVKDWVVDGSSIGSTGNTYTINNLDAEVNVQVEFEPITHEVSFGVEAGDGAISAAADGSPVSTGDKVEEGSEVVFTAEPEAGNKVKDWIVDGSSIGSTDNTYTIDNLDAEVNVQVEFEPITYEVSFDVEAGDGTISAAAGGSTVSTGDKVAEGSEVVFTAEPGEDNQIKDWIVDGSSIGSTDNTYTIESLENDVTVKVEFEGVVGMDNLSSGETSIFPNPASNYVKAESDGQINKLKFINTSGKTVYEKQVNSHNAYIDVSALPNGLYIVQIIGDQKTQNHRLQITR